MEWVIEEFLQYTGMDPESPVVKAPVALSTRQHQISRPSSKGSTIRRNEFKRFMDSGTEIIYWKGQCGGETDKGRKTDGGKTKKGQKQQTLDLEGFMLTAIAKPENCRRQLEQMASGEGDKQDSKDKE